MPTVLHIKLLWVKLVGNNNKVVIVMQQKTIQFRSELLPSATSGLVQSLGLDTDSWSICYCCFMQKAANASRSGNYSTTQRRSQWSSSL